MKKIFIRRKYVVGFSKTENKIISSTKKESTINIMLKNRSDIMSFAHRIIYIIAIIDKN